MRLTTASPKILGLLLGLAAALFTAPAFAAEGNVDAVVEKHVAAITNEVGQVIKDSKQAATDKLNELWRRIDERRLVNRKPDQIVAMVIMGLLVGSLLFRFGRSGQVLSIVFGMIGAFVGGILANVTKLDLGLGPVLITYEDLLFTLAGGIVMLFVLRAFSSKKSKA